MKSYLVTATPPTPNGGLHVGHLSGPYFAADVFCRYQRMRGNRPVYLCSSDDNQSYMMTTARRQGRAPVELAEDNTRLIRSTLAAAGIELDLYTSALGNMQHTGFVQAFFTDLYQRGRLKRKVAPALFCTTCKHHLFESFAKGRCPECGEEAAGNLCEACGRVNDPVTLWEPRCALCHNRPILTEYEGLFLPLDDYCEALASYYASRSSWRPHLQALCDWLVSHPLPDYPVSYPSAWGIPVPIDGFEGQVINVWFEMYPGHIATTRAWAELQGDPDLADRLWAGEAELVQFLGYDNSFFNAVLHPALGLACGGRYLLPKHIITNEFYRLGKEKFSTSRNHAIWGHNVLAKVQADALRYYLSRTNPEQMQTSFCSHDFAKVVRDDLVGLWNRAINGFLACARDVPDGLCQGPQCLDLQARGLSGWTRTWLERYYNAEEFSLRQAGAVLHAYVEGCSDYLDRMVVPLRDGNEDIFKKRLASLSYLMKGLASFSAPLMPAFAQRLWSTFGLKGQVIQEGWPRSDRETVFEPHVGPLQDWFLTPSDD
jgi:methionyl-tRNA synthetase